MGTAGGRTGQGPLAHGFAGDQRWTLGRIKTLIGKLFHVGYTVEGTRKLMRRHGWSAQVPVRQAIERDEQGHRGVEEPGVTADKSAARKLVRHRQSKPCDMHPSYCSALVHS